jgi:hypothetical protein
MGFLHTPGHTRESVHLPVSDLRAGPVLSLGREEFVAAVAEAIPARLPEMDAILQFDQGGAP